MDKPSDQSGPDLWAVWRIDDTGNTFLVRDRLTKAEADRAVEEFTAHGHKQTYWAEREAEAEDKAEVRRQQ